VGRIPDLRMMTSELFLLWRWALGNSRKRKYKGSSCEQSLGVENTETVMYFFGDVMRIGRRQQTVDASVGGRL